MKHDSKLMHGFDIRFVQSLQCFTHKLIILGCLCLFVHGCEYIRKIGDGCTREWDLFDGYPIELIQQASESVSHDYVEEQFHTKHSRFAGYTEITWNSEQKPSYYLLEFQIFSYNGSWPENGTTHFYTCCEKNTDFARNNGTFDFSGTNQRVFRSFHTTADCLLARSNLAVDYGEPKTSCLLG
ncbi:unnamed protein product [Fasciola hepatica]|uniref:Uncharacterized protein n=1 Tax=Fasciola hepatica TaxID=6192 RepID=A0ABC9HJ30_FASHE